jgi:gamma-glutamyltranspeptidase / glutathione hydrolase
MSGKKRPAWPGNLVSVTTESSVIAEQCTGRGANGVVCAAAPLAAQAGARAMRDGGNAFDAVVCAALAETVLLPSKCGLGGDLVAIVLRAGAAHPEALLAIGGAPRGLAEVASHGSWSDTGPMSVGPPAAPAGYLTLARAGRLGLDRLAAPAIELATGGFPWATVNHRLAVASVELLRRWNPEGTSYLPSGEPIAAGDLVTLPGLASALASFVERGDAFLAGPVGQAIVAAVQQHGGVLDSGDLAEVSAEWTECTQVDVGARTVWATPAPTHGPTLLAAVANAQPGDDPATQYRRVLAAINRGRDQIADPSGTSIVSAADRDGDCVVVVHSNSYPRYGSGLVVADYDLVLANRAGRGFTPEPGHPNFPVAGHRPATTLHAWAVAGDNGRPRFLGGTPGGENQVVWNAQLLQAIIDGESAVGSLVTGPRWEWLPADDGVRIEAGFDEAAAAALEASAPRAVSVGRWGLPCAQQVIAAPEEGLAIVGAADPRTVGLALGV